MFDELDQPQLSHRRFFHLLAIAFDSIERAKSAKETGDLTRAMEILDEGLVESTAMLPVFLSRLHYRTIAQLFQAHPSADKHLAAAALLQARTEIHGLRRNRREALKEARLAYDLYHLIDAERVDPRFRHHYDELFPAVKDDLNAAAGRRQ